MIKTIKKILYLAFIYIALIVLFINADSTTKATESVVTSTVKQSEESNQFTSTTNETKKVDSVTGASEDLVTTTSEIATTTTSTTTSTTTTIQSEEKVDSVTGASEGFESISTTTTTTTIQTTTSEIMTVITTTSTILVNDGFTTTTILDLLVREDIIKPDVKVRITLIGEDQTNPVFISTKDSKITELKEDFELVKINRDNKTKTIIFDENSSQILPTLDYKNDKMESFNEKMYYQLPDFKPRNLDEFYMAEPEITYDENGVVKTGSISIKNDLCEKIFKKAEDLFKENKLKSAQIIFEKLLYYNYDVVRVCFYVSQCHYLVKDYLKAVSYLKYAIDYDKEKGKNSNLIANYYFHIGTIYFELQEYNSAVSYFILSVDTDNNLSENYYHIGLCYYKLNDLENALIYWKKGSDAGNIESKTSYNWLKESIKK